MELTFTLNSPEDFVIHFQIHIGTFDAWKGPLDTSSSTMCYGYDLAEFARELEALHDRYDGRASFINQVGDFELNLEMVDKGRGTVAVEVCYGHSGVNETKTTLREFATDQSYLPGLAEEIWRFLAETGVSPVHPMS